MKNTMKITELLIFTTTAVILYSMSSSGIVDAWWSMGKHDAGSISGSLGYRSGCSSNSDCHHSERCKNSECVSACHEKDCDGSHEACLVRHNKAKCVCKFEYAKNTDTKICEKEGCQTNRNCTGTLLCEAVNNVRTCKCPTGTKSRENGFCAISCKTNANCELYGSDAECESGVNFCKCKTTKAFNPETKLCG